MYQNTQEESISIKDTQDVSEYSRRIYKYQGYSRCIRILKKNILVSRILKMYQNTQEEYISIKDTQDESEYSRRIY